MALLTISEVTRRFGGLTAVDRVSFEVEEGEIIGVIGPNGAGKSTLFNVIAGFLAPDHGEIRLRGQRISGQKPHRIAALGLVKTFQLVKPFGSMTVKENLLVPLLRRGLSFGEAERRAASLTERLGLAGMEDAHPGQLPYAWKRRLEIGRALAAGPRVMLLDEALAGLTPVELADILGTLREIHESGVTLLLIEHVMDATMELCGRIVVLDEGRVIASGTPAQVTQDARVIDAYLGQNA